MKRKVLNQKLSLNKETIAKLDSDELKSVKGGSAWVCASIIAANAYQVGHDESWWACEFTHGCWDGGGGGGGGTASQSCDPCNSLDVCDA